MSSLDEKINGFAKGSFDKGDFNWFFFFIMLALTALTISIISPDEPAGKVYKDISLFSLVVIAVAFVAMKSSFGKKLPIAFVGISGGSLLQSGLTGFGIGLLLTAGQFGFGSFLSPLSIPALSVVAAGSIGAIFLLSIYVSEMEETLRASVLFPSVLNGIKQFGLSLALVFGGTIVYFILGSQTLGIGLFILGIALGFVPKINQTISNNLLLLGVGLAVSGLVFASLHLLAYGTSLAALQFVFVYALIADGINLFNGNTISSRIAHTINNGALAAVAIGQTPFLGLLFGGVHFTLIYLMRKTTVKAF